MSNKQVVKVLWINMVALIVLALSSALGLYTRLVLENKPMSSLDVIAVASITFGVLCLTFALALVKRNNKKEQKKHVK